MKYCSKGTFSKSAATAWCLLIREIRMGVGGMESRKSSVLAAVLIW